MSEFVSEFVCESLMDRQVYRGASLLITYKGRGPPLFELVNAFMK